MPVCFRSLTSNHGPALPVRVYGGDLPVSQQSDWFMEHIPDLHAKVLLPAYRAAFKMALDAIILGDTYDKSEDLEETLQEIDNSWYLGMENDVGWQESVLKEMPNLFSVGVVDRSSGGGGARQLYKSHRLTLTDCDVGLGRLNPEVVKGLWASLNLELLYLTNDDDERYSIQAEERLLRNLTVQVADPPLGYTIFSSEAIRQGVQVI